MADDAVIKTNDEAASCKITLLELGYIKDEFLQHFVKKAPRKSPIINRGYFARVHLIQLLYDTFISCVCTNSQLQVINLGAGFDTTFWNIKNKYPNLAVKFVEMDLMQVVQRKKKAIEQSPLLMKTLQNCVAQQNALVSDEYVLCVADLRDVQQVEHVLLNVAKLDKNIPTIVISECVLIYIEPEQSNAVLKFLSQTFTTQMVVLYEQIFPHDIFGKTMVQNLIMRGCPLKSIDAFPTPAVQSQRLKNASYTHAACQTMKQLYLQFMDPVEKKRIEKIEMLDEYEEWYMLMEHYCISLGVQVPESHGLKHVDAWNTFFKKWQF